MAQWSQSERTLYTKIVYYGPAYGGKTTNLESLHQITDPQNRQALTSIQTAEDRTIFFDLLPFDLGEILGYQVAIKLYTVPGQVRYETARQVVLAGADAIIFVADSSIQREEQNRWSVQNLRMNMRSKGLDPAVVPVLFQANKQDLPDAAAPETVASWIGLRQRRTIPAVAIEDRGVIETFKAACHAMLERLIELADEKTRSRIEIDKLNRHVEEAFVPIQASLAVATKPAGERADRQPDNQIILGSENLLAESIQANQVLSERFSHEEARARRLEREAGVLRKLNDSLRKVGSNFEGQANVDAVLCATAATLDVPVVSLLYQPAEGLIQHEFGWQNEHDPLIGFEEGRQLLLKMLNTGRACVIGDLASECSSEESAKFIEGLQAVIAAPIEAPKKRLLVAYAAEPKKQFDSEDMRFLVTVAGNLAVSLEKTRLYSELSAHRDRLEELVEQRTLQLSRTLEELARMEQMKDRLLGNLSHEMKTPLTAILSSGVYLRDYESGAEEKAEMVGTIINSAQVLEKLLDELFRMVNLGGGEDPLQYEEATIPDLVQEAALLAGRKRLSCKLNEEPGKLWVDRPRIIRALANLIENAFKFSSGRPRLELRVVEQGVRVGKTTVPGVAISILDRGPGIDSEDKQRLFSPFEQGGDRTTGKPAGIGIGLHEARTIARQHSGDLDHHARQGGGSEFRLILPLQQAAKSVPEGKTAG